MKKSFFLLPILMAVTILTASAKEPVKEKTQQAFEKHFSGAENASWAKTSNGLDRVAFVWGGLRTFAYFNNAELVGTARNITYDRVPITIVRAVESDFKQPVVTEVTEISAQDGTSYIIKLEEKGRRYEVRIGSFGEVLEKTRLKK